MCPYARKAGSCSLGSRKVSHPRLDRGAEVSLEDTTLSIILMTIIII